MTYTQRRDALIRRVVAAGEQAVATHPDTASALLRVARDLHAGDASFQHAENILRLAQLDTLKEPA